MTEKSQQPRLAKSQSRPLTGLKSVFYVGTMRSPPLAIRASAGLNSGSDLWLSATGAVLNGG
jgi:hypothetical protein